MWKRSLKIVLAASLALLSFSCFWNGEQNANGSANVNSAADQNADAAANTNETAAANKSVTQQETDVIPKTAEISSLKTPTETYKTYAVATLNKDVEIIKQTLSKAALQFVENAARERGSTAAEILTGGAVQNTARKIPEIKNEKIEGNKATIEVKNEMGFYDTIPFVMENGEWKIALDELNKQAQKKLEDIKKRLSETK